MCKALLPPPPIHSPDVPAPARWYSRPLPVYCDRASRRELVFIRRQCKFATMPRGKYVNHKGRNRNFTNPEELEAQRKKDEEEKKWRKTREQDSDEDEDEDGDGEENDSDESDSEEEENAKGAAGVIQIQNPNRVAKKSHRKVEEVAEDDEPQLTRREKEELEKQRAAAAYQKRHAEGKTAQAKADLARLAIIKQHRAEAAARREAEKKVG
uniref:Casein kinase substrate phosphoprotein PP28 domain-containing protein n=1 Tax=Anopheles merus TaxID=30066 RepID=A0A182VNF9_ANOME